MTTLREAAQQALEALERLYNDTEIMVTQDQHRVMKGAITALRAALAEHDKKIVWVEERKAHWAEQLQLARETQERERQQREEAALAEPVQEPAGWFEGPFGEFRANQLFKHSWPAQTVAWSIPLYLAPPQRKPLTEEEEIAELARQEQFLLICDGLEELTEITRSVERAHDIT